jgi:hypothetical protein
MGKWVIFQGLCLGFSVYNQGYEYDAQPLLLV